MKQFRFLSYLFVAVLCLGFVSCSDDDDDDNVLTYNSESFKIKGALFYYYGEEYGNDSYNFDLCLYGDGFDMNNEDKGNYLYAEMYSSSDTELTPGIYTYNTNEKENTFSWLYIHDNNGNDMGFTKGTITVKKSGNTYEFIIAGTDANGIALTAYYRGGVKTYVDED